MSCIYLDNNATTPVDPRVRDAIAETLGSGFGNPASAHEIGRDARSRLERAREYVADAIGANSPAEIVFTSGATESNNLFVKGACDPHEAASQHVVTTQVEHASVLEPCKALARDGVAITCVAPGADGVLDAGDIARAVTPNTRLVSVMMANNEVGSIQPVAEIAGRVKRADLLVHVDGAQAFGKIPFRIRELEIDAMSLSAHKVYGPKGVGALYLRGGVQRWKWLRPQLEGGGQESGLRAGTPAMPLIVGFGEAARILIQEGGRDVEHATGLARLLWNRLTASVDDVVLNGPADNRLPGNINVSFMGVDAQSLMAAVPSLALSTGSACNRFHSGASHVLTAMGASDARRRSAVRISVGRFTTKPEVESALTLLCQAVRRVRSGVVSAP